jgi:hypothetical protein
LAEADWHVFVECDVTRESWYWAGLSTILLQQLGRFNNMAAFMFDICRYESCDTTGRVAVLQWHICAARIELVWIDVRQTPTVIGRNALSSWQQ